jgi:hypothetical protein
LPNTTVYISIAFTQQIWGLTEDRFCHSGVNDTAVTKIGDFVVYFLRKFEVILKSFSPRIRGLGGVLLWKKTRGRKSRVIVPLSFDWQALCGNTVWENIKLSLLLPEPHAIDADPQHTVVVFFFSIFCCIRLFDSIISLFWAFSVYLACPLRLSFSWS